MEIEDAIPVDDSLLLTISIAGFLVMGTSIYWIFFRERKNDDEDTAGRNHPNSRAARRAQTRQERKQSDSGNHQHRKQLKRRPFEPDSTSGREVDAAAKRDKVERELELKRKQREEEAAAAFACFYGPVSVADLSKQRVLDVDELCTTCGASPEQIRNRIEQLIRSKRWAGFFQEKDAEVVGPTDAGGGVDDTVEEERCKPRLHFIRIFDTELQLIADSVKSRQRVTLNDIAKITQQILDRDEKKSIE